MASCKTPAPASPPRALFSGELALQPGSWPITIVRSCNGNPSVHSRRPAS